jgi:hypothetical protein
MSSNDRKLIAVIGATGQQGGAVVRALQASGQFKVRALTRHPGKHRDLAEEVVEADLDRPETLKAAFEGAHGVFLVTNFWEAGTDEIKQATAAVRAAKDAGVMAGHQADCHRFGSPHPYKKSRAIERSQSRWQTSSAPTKARKLPCSRKVSCVHNSRICVSMRICQARPASKEVRAGFRPLRKSI